jgi:hypothetical protein
VAGGQATVRINLVEGQVDPFDALTTLRSVARAHGATRLRIEGTTANTRLYRALKIRYGPRFRTEGATESIEFDLDPE